MEKIALLFPGQGSQSIGMGQDFYHNFPQAKEIFDKADTILKINLSKLCFDGPLEDLTRTSNVQPAIYTVSIAILEVLKHQIKLAPHACAGHSLGEYSAYTAAEKLSFQEGCLLVRERGILMEQADPDKNGGMAAVIGMELSQIQTLIKSYQQKGTITIANYNTDKQTVISGEKRLLGEIQAKIEQEGAKCTMLNVDGAFHSPIVQAAADQLKFSIEKTSLQSSRIPVITNVTGTPVKESEIKPTLIKQITSPVYWNKSMQYLIDQGFTLFLEIGNGRVLTNLLKRIHRKAECYNISDLASFEHAMVKMEKRV